MGCKIIKKWYLTPPQKIKLNLDIWKITWDYFKTLVYLKLTRTPLVLHQLPATSLGTKLSPFLLNFVPKLVAANWCGDKVDDQYIGVRIISIVQQYFKVTITDLFES